MRTATAPTTETLAMIAATAVKIGPNTYSVLSSDGKTRYFVTPMSCTCPDWQKRKVKTGERCKHLESVELICPPAPLPKPFQGDAFAGFDAPRELFKRSA